MQSHMHIREGDTRRCPECGGYQVLVSVGSDRGDMTMHITEWRCINSPLGHRESGPLTDSKLQNAPRLPRCSTCKHWERNARAIIYEGEPPDRRPVQIGECSSRPANMGARHHSSLVADGIAMHMLTYPDFGCVNHESEETT